MSSPFAPSGNTSSSFRISPARICSVAFSVFILTLAYGSYVDYCVLPRIYEATAQIQVAQPLDPESPDPIRAEIEFMTSPDVLAPIVTDLELDKVWARRFRTELDALPMQDALAYFHHILRVQQVPGTRIVNITVSSEVPKEVSDIANAVANRYETEREAGADQLFAEKERILQNEIAQQATTVAQKSSAIEAIRSQLHHDGTPIAPGAAGLIAAEIAAQKSDASSQINPLAPLVSAQAQLDAQQSALDDLQLKLRQEKTNHQLAGTPVHIIALAEPPEFPSSPDHKLDLMIAVVEAIVLAVVAPVLLELLLWFLTKISPPTAKYPAIPSSGAAASTNY